MYWCFVDANNCERPRELSKYFINTINGVLTDIDLAWSSTTCGWIDDYSQPDQLAALPPLRISFPGHESHRIFPASDVEGRDGNGIADSGFYGSFVKFVFDTLTEYGVKWYYVPVSPSSKIASPESSYTACVHEIALGNTDLCVGPFWVTAERRAMATFTATVDLDYMHVILPRKRDKGHGHSVWADFWCTPGPPIRPRVAV